MAKREQKHDVNMGQENRLQSLGFDPERLRIERENALMRASNAPLFSGKVRMQPHPAEIYPHVYDAQLKAQQESAFVGGAKV